MNVAHINAAGNWRPLLAMLLMVGAAAMSVFARPTEQVAATRPPLDLETLIPASFGGWSEDTSIVPLQPSPEVQAVIERTYDQVLARTYRDAQGRRMMLSIAYGGSQDDSMNYHRPDICYPAQGFRIVEAPQAGSVELPVGGLPVQRMVAAAGSRNEPITYWLVVGDQLTSFGVQHRWTTLKYGLTGRIPDGMLVRVSSINSDNKKAFAEQEEFIRAMLEGLSPDGRERLLGALQL